MSVIAFRLEGMVRIIDYETRLLGLIGDTLFQKSSKFRLSKDAIALTTIPSFISKYQV